jgi:hypothetical protein
LNRTQLQKREDTEHLGGRQHPLLTGTKILSAQTESILLTLFAYYRILLNERNIPLREALLMLSNHEKAMILANEAFANL